MKQIFELCDCLLKPVVPMLAGYGRVIESIDPLIVAGVAWSVLIVAMGYLAKRQMERAMAEFLADLDGIDPHS